MKKLSIILLTMLIISMSISGNCITASAASNEADYSVTNNQSNQPTLLKSEKDYIGGVEVEVNQYNDNGYIVETVGIAENSTNTKSLTNDTVLQKDFKNELMKYGDSRYLDYYGYTHGDTDNQQLHTMSYSGPYEYHKGEQCSTNSNCYVGHWGFITATTLTPFVIEAYDGACRGLYSTGTAKNIQLSETYSFSGLALSISWPAGVSLSGSGQSRTWSSIPYNSTSMATAYRPDFSGTSLTSIWSVTIDSRSDIYIGSISYATTVSTSAGVWDWVGL